MCLEYERVSIKKTVWTENRLTFFSVERQRA